MNQEQPENTLQIQAEATTALQRERGNAEVVKELILQSDKACLDLGQWLIKSLMVLNGGAILALTTILGHFLAENTNAYTPAQRYSMDRAFVYSGLLFLAGLVISFFSGLSLYFTIVRANLAHRLRYLQTIETEFQASNSPLSGPDKPSEFSARALKLGKYDRIYARLRKVTIFLSLFSLGLFIWGACRFGHAALQVVEHVHTAPITSTPPQ